MLRIVFPESRELGCPVSEFVRKSAREPSREASRADFRTIGQFGSARLTVGQAKNFRPRLGRRSDRGRNFVRMPTPAQLLTVNPAKRLDCEAVLDHEFFWSNPMPCSLEGRVKHRTRF